MTWEEIDAKHWRKAKQQDLIYCAKSIDQLKEDNLYMTAKMCEGAIKELERRGFTPEGKRIPYIEAPDENPRSLRSKLRRFRYRLKQEWYDTRYYDKNYQEVK